LAGEEGGDKPRPYVPPYFQNRKVGSELKARRCYRPASIWSTIWNCCWLTFSSPTQTSAR
jgi:hypothetical protein